MALGVLLLVEAAVGVVDGADMGADDVEELVPGNGRVAGAVREEDGGGAQAEEAVGDEHGALVPSVPAASNCHDRMWI